jgi:phosphoribosylformylglycinamidine cyclo-ligase
MAQRPSSPRSAQLTYRDSGVDIDAGNEAVRRIRKLVESTRRPEQIDGLGGFAGLTGLPPGIQDPVLVSCADGVGSKLLVAIALDRHDTVGIDAVAMNINDLIVTGARPLFVLDYIATHTVQPAVIEALVRGIAQGCRQAECALLGGETAELPDLYAEGHYDLAAFAVGVAGRNDLMDRARVHAGDAIVGLPSSGLHSNGYSLARRALLDPAHAGLALEDPLPGGTGETVGEALLEPTLIYAPAFAALRQVEGAPLHGAAHITGGGLIDNPPRTIPDDLAVEIDLGDVPLPPVIQAVKSCGVSDDELRRTFNCGLGMLLYVDRDRVAEVKSALSAAGQPSSIVGSVIQRPGPDTPQVRISG